MSHILDDFIFFGHPGTTECQKNLNHFLSLADHLNLPIKHSKTVLPCTVIQLHGIEVDTLKMQMRLPEDKLQDIKQKLKVLTYRKKVTLAELQSLIGSLNFACRVVVPGRTFLRRLIDLTSGVTSPRHLVRLTVEARKDITAWEIFLQSYNGISMCLPTKWTSANTINLYSDACGFGFAATYGRRWLQGSFPQEWAQKSIALKELLPIVLAIKVWSNLLANSRILFFTDNESVMHVINSQTSKNTDLMSLLRTLVVATMTYNIELRAKHIPGRCNVICDLLSRFQEHKAREVYPGLAKEKDPIPPAWLPW